MIILYFHNNVKKKNYDRHIINDKLVSYNNKIISDVINSDSNFTKKFLFYCSFLMYQILSCPLLINLPS